MHVSCMLYPVRHQHDIYIYMLIDEKIRDLLNPRLSDNLKIREGSQGVWIQGMSHVMSQRMPSNHHHWVCAYEMI